MKNKLSPILKWAGGKERELKYILPAVPEKINRYFEPFVGGGAVYFAVNIKNSYINDKSEELINLYRLIQENNREFFDILTNTYSKWSLLENIVQKNSPFLIERYQKISNNGSCSKYLRELSSDFIHSNKKTFKNIISPVYINNSENFITELTKNLTDKAMRMKKLEEENGRLSHKDIVNNFESSIKSAFYMHLRYLYNNIKNLNIDRPFAGALFYFIREYCYASMFRYNKKGFFNVPYGGISYNRKDLSKKINYLKSEELASYISKTRIYNMDFEAFFEKTGPENGDFIFLDPPYDSDFKTYAKNDFNHCDQERLANYLYSTEANFMVVIKNTDFIYNLYKNRGFIINTINKKYLVSFRNRNDRKAKHLIITNYK